jgi:hypothetical protein
MAVPTTQQIKRVLSLPTSAQTRHAWIEQAEERAARAPKIMAVIAPSIAAVMLARGYFSFASIPAGLSIAPLMCAVAAAFILFVVGTLAVSLALRSTTLMLIMHGGISRTPTAILVWAEVYADEEFRNGSEFHRARSVMRWARVWLRRFTPSQRENLFKLAQTCNCTAGELKLIVAQL